MVLEDVVEVDQIRCMQDWFSTRAPNVVKTKPDGHPFHREWLLDYHLDTPVTRILRSVIDPIMPNALLFSGAYRESFYPFGLHIDTSQESWDSLPNTLLDNPNMVSYDTAVIIPFDGNAGARTVVFDVSTRYWEPGQTECYAANMDNGLDPADFQHIANSTDRYNITRLPLLVDYHWRPGSMVLWKRDKLHTAADFIGRSASKKAITMFFW